MFYSTYIPTESFDTFEPKKKPDYSSEQYGLRCFGGGGMRTPVLTCHPLTSTSLVDVLCFRR